MLPPTSRKARWAALAAASIAMLSVGASRSETVQAPRERIRIVKVAQPARIVTKTKIVKVEVPQRPPSGFVTSDDCRAIKVGMRFQDMIYRYGWPAFDEGDTSTGFFDYPIVGDHDRTCSVDLVDHLVVSSSLR